MTEDKGGEGDSGYFVTCSVYPLFQKSSMSVILPSATPIERIHNPLRTVPCNLSPRYGWTLYQAAGNGFDGRSPRFSPTLAGG
jgi:hypothetical protein